MVSTIKVRCGSGGRAILSGDVPSECRSELCRPAAGTGSLRFSATARYMAKRTAAGPLIVMEVVTWSSGNAVEQSLHVGEGGNGDPAISDFAASKRIIRVETHEGRQVEGDAQAGLAVIQQIFEACVRVVRRAEPGELPHSPEPAAIHVGITTAGVRGRAPGCPRSFSALQPLRSSGP